MGKTSVINNQSNVKNQNPRTKIPSSQSYTEIRYLDKISKHDENVDKFNNFIKLDYNLEGKIRDNDKNDEYSKLNNGNKGDYENIFLNKQYNSIFEEESNFNTLEAVNNQEDKESSISKRRKRTKYKEEDDDNDEEIEKSLFEDFNYKNKKSNKNIETSPILSSNMYGKDEMDQYFIDNDQMLGRQAVDYNTNQVLPKSEEELLEELEALVKSINAGYQNKKGVEECAEILCKYFKSTIINNHLTSNTNNSSESASNNTFSPGANKLPNSLFLHQMKYLNTRNLKQNLQSNSGSRKRNKGKDDEFNDLTRSLSFNSITELNFKDVIDTIMSFSKVKNKKNEKVEKNEKGDSNIKSGYSSNNTFNIGLGGKNTAADSTFNIKVGSTKQSPDLGIGKIVSSLNFITTPTKNTDFNEITEETDLDKEKNQELSDYNELGIIPKTFILTNDNNKISSQDAKYNSNGKRSDSSNKSDGYSRNSSFSNNQNWGSLSNEKSLLNINDIITENLQVSETIKIMLLGEILPKQRFLKGLQSGEDYTEVLSNEGKAKSLTEKDKEKENEYKKDFTPR